MPTRPPVHRPTGWKPPQVRRADYDRQRGSASQRGYDAAWVAFRASILARRPRCETCGSAVRLNVHHKTTLRRDPARRLDPTNVTVLCQACHSRHTAKNDGGFGR